MSNPDKNEAVENIKANNQKNVWVPRKRRSELPVEKIETEAERQLKEQAKKQTDTNVTLMGDLHKRKKFTQSYTYKPLSSAVSGTLNLDSYKQLSEKDLELEKLKSYGLTDDEIELKLSADEKQLFMIESMKQRSKYGTDPLIKQSLLKSIEEKVKVKNADLEKDTTFEGTKKMSRHEMDLEKALSHNQEKKAFLGILLSDKKTMCMDTEDPGSDLKKMLNEIEGKLGNQDQSEDAEDWSDPESESSTSQKLVPETTGCADCDKLRLMNRYFVGPLLKTEYDYYEKCDKCKQLRNKEYNERIVDKSGGNKKRKNRKNKKSRLRLVNSKMKDTVVDERSIKSSDIVVKEKDGIPETEDDRNSMVDTEHMRQGSLNLNSDINKKSDVVAKTVVVHPDEVIPVDVIERYKLSEEQIKQIPKFANYTPGMPSNMLYLKNLSKKVTEHDLMCLFSHFHQAESPIQYRLLSGRMRGQAFITFNDSETASKALELVNGYDFKGKPIIIEYGKKTV